MRSEFLIRDEVAYIKSGEFKKRLHVALIEMGPKPLKPQYRHLWSPDNPTFGYCYYLSEYLYYARLHKIPTPKYIPTPLGSHWFLVPYEGKVLDLAQDRRYDYSLGISQNFIGGKMSKTATRLGHLLDD